jgi:hypothetical protein
VPDELDLTDASGADAALEQELRELARRVDPVPEQVMEAARRSFVWRTVDAELAELAYDSAASELQPAGVRGAGAPRILSFVGEELSVDLEVSDVGGGRRLVGQLVPPREATLELRHAGGAMALTADAIGRFSAGPVPGGAVSLRCATGPGHAVETAWIRI